MSRVDYTVHGLEMVLPIAGYAQERLLATGESVLEAFVLIDDRVDKPRGRSVIYESISIRGICLRVNRDYHQRTRPPSARGCFVPFKKADRQREDPSILFYVAFIDHGRQKGLSVEKCQSRIVPSPLSKPRDESRRSIPLAKAREMRLSRYFRIKDLPDCSSVACVGRCIYIRSIPGPGVIKRGSEYARGCIVCL